MSLAEIEAELENLRPEELRDLALKSWNAFLEKAGRAPHTNECSEDDPALLAALEAALGEAEAARAPGCSAAEVRARLNTWTSK
jgi:hypothetical protein